MLMVHLLLRLLLLHILLRNYGILHGWLLLVLLGHHVGRILVWRVVLVVIPIVIGVGIWVAIGLLEVGVGIPMIGILVRVPLVGRGIVGGTVVVGLHQQVNR